MTTITAKLLGLIAWEEKRCGVKPDYIRITTLSLETLKAEVESGCLVLYSTDEQPTFNGVKLEVLD